MKYEQKVKQYNSGEYVLLKVPPVPTTYWTLKDWITFVDNNGTWNKIKIS